MKDIVVLSNQPEPQKYGVYFGRWAKDRNQPKEVPIIYDYVHLDFLKNQLVCGTWDGSVLEKYDVYLVR